jgi:HAD superfamily hydrolase (TIGR01509 family)
MSKFFALILALIGGFMNLNAGDIKAIIFDCDGTLVDSEPTHHLSYRHVLKKWGADLTSEEYLLFVGNPVELNVKILAEKMGADCAEEILDAKRAKYRELHQKGHPPIQATIEFLHRLASEKERLGLKVGLASASPKDEILLNLQQHQIEHLFDVILSGKDDLGEYRDPEGINKPKPYIYLHAAKLLDLSPQQCVVIEDSRSGVTAGVDAGCFVIAVPNSYTKHHDLSHAHLKIESFSDMSVEEFLKMVAPQ